MIADQLGHSRVSMTQDVFLSRRAGNAANLAALEAYNPDLPSATDGGKTRVCACVPIFVPIGPGSRGRRRRFTLTL